MTRPPRTDEQADVGPFHTYIDTVHQTWSLTNLEAIPDHGALFWFSSDETRGMAASRLLLPGQFTACGLTIEEDSRAPDNRALFAAIAASPCGTGLTLEQTRHTIAGALNRAWTALANITLELQYAHYLNDAVTDLSLAAACYALDDRTDRTVALAIFNAGKFTGTADELVAVATAANHSTAQAIPDITESGR